MLANASYHGVVPPVLQPRFMTGKLAPFQDSKSSHKVQQAVAVAKSINVSAVKPEIEHFFDHYLHDSVAGFIGKRMNEYTHNGMGFAKFRTIFKGND